MNSCKICNCSSFSEIVRLRSRWNNSLRELWNLMLSHQVKWNKSTHARRHFTLRSNISHAKRISQIPQGIYFVEKDLCFVSKHRSFSGGGEGSTPLLQNVMLSSLHGGGWNHPRSGYIFPSSLFTITYHFQKSAAEKSEKWRVKSE